MLSNQPISKDIATDEYLLFLNSLNSKIKLIKIIEIRDHSIGCSSCWKGLQSFICVSDRQDIYEIDLRFAWNERVFEENLYDFGWDKSTLLSINNSPRQKLIFYLCSSSVNLDSHIHDLSVPTKFLVGKYWKSIDHFYLKFPLKHPFDPAIFQHPDLRRHLQLTDQEISLPSKNISNDRQIAIEGGLRTRGVSKINAVDRPLISVITVVFNGEQKIEQTIQSVINQNHENFEYIIIDGGSSDRTIEIIKRYADRIDYWKSEEDLGIYDAMNKGINLATGEWLNFMNCGDLFYSGRSLSGIPLKPSVDFYYSDTILYDSNGNTKLRICSQEHRDVIHQSIVYRKYLHSAYKYLVHDNLTISDYFFFRRNDCKNWSKLSVPLSIYNVEGVSGNGSKSFTQKLFVKFMSGDISEFKMSLLIMAKILRSPFRRIQNMLVSLSILKPSGRF